MYVRWRRCLQQITYIQAKPGPDEATSRSTMRMCASEGPRPGDSVLLVVAEHRSGAVLSKRRLKTLLLVTVHHTDPAVDHLLDRVALGLGGRLDHREHEHVLELLVAFDGDAAGLTREVQQALGLLLVRRAVDADGPDDSVLAREALGYGNLAENCG